MHTDFRNFTVTQDSYNHAYTETLETIRIDLSSYVSRLSRKYVDMLFPPPPGVYLNAHINPFLVFGEGRGYFSKAAMVNREDSPDIVCFDDVWRHPGLIYSNEGAALFNAVPSMASCFSEYPLWHPGAIYLAYIYALEEFRYSNPMAQPFSNMERQMIDLRQHVRPEFLPVYDGTYSDYVLNRNANHFYDEENEDLIELGVTLKKFVGLNRNSVFRFYLNNTTMTVERGNDFRIIEYYRLISAHMSEM